MEIQTTVDITKEYVIQKWLEDALEFQKQRLQEKVKLFTKDELEDYLKTNSHNYNIIDWDEYKYEY